MLIYQRVPPFGVSKKGIPEIFPTFDGDHFHQKCHILGVDIQFSDILMASPSETIGFLYLSRASQKLRIWVWLKNWENQNPVGWDLMNLAH